MTIGICASWETNEPQTEAVLFERIDQTVLKVGEETIMIGAIVTAGGLFISSRAMRANEGVIEIHGVQGSRAEILVLRRGCDEPFASSLSLAW